MHDPIMDYDYLTLDIPYLHIILVGLYLYCAYSTCSEMQTSLKLSSSLLKLYYQSFFLNLYDFSFYLLLYESLLSDFIA